MHAAAHSEPVLACVYSLPRSGSTALMAQLDRWKGIVCIPESYFPQMLELLTPEEFSNSKRMAELFLASSDSGSALTLDEAERCMVPNDATETLKRLGLTCAEKTQRDPAQVKAVVWKTTRIVGRWKLFARAGGRFIVLRRNPLNVFESQFRVDFGRNNRNALRFAAFAESYEAAFARLPKHLTARIDYESIPEQLPTILSFLGLSHQELWTSGHSLLARTAATRDWHGRILDDFQSRDSEQSKNLSVTQRFALRFGRTMFLPARPVTGMLRDYYDRGVMDYLRTKKIEN